MSAATMDDGDILDELLGEVGKETEPDEETEIEAEADEPEAEPEPEADDAEPDAETEPTEDDAEPGDEDDDEMPAAAEEKAEPQSELDRALADAAKREEGLRKEVTRLREKVRERELMQAQAPAPTRPEAAPPPPPVAGTGALSEIEQQVAKAGGVPVVVSEDGSQVYVSNDELRKAIAEEASRIVEERTRPTPEQVAAEEHRRLVGEFVAKDEDGRRKAAVDMLDQVNELLEAQVRADMPPGGYQTEDQLVYMIRNGELRTKVQEYFPAMAPLYDEFIDAFRSNQTSWKRSVLERIASGIDRSEEGSPERSTPRLESVANVPRSMARKGGVRSESPSVDESEFASLEKKFRDDPFTMPDKQYKRYLALGKKLGKSGLE